MKSFAYTTIKCIILILAVLFANKLQAQTLTTDAADYPPGATVTLTGTGFQGGETVLLQVLHEDVDGGGIDSLEAHQPWEVIADNDGNFTTTWIVFADGDEVGATLTATADGQSSGLHAETTFTDAISYSETVSPTAFCPGATVTLTFTVTTIGTPGNLGCFQVTIPAGYTSPSGPLMVSAPSGKNWTASLVSSNTILRASANDPASRIVSGESIQFRVTVIAPASGTASWSTVSNNTCAFTGVAPSGGNPSTTASDAIAPVINCPISVTVQCASEVPVVNTGSVSATDNCGTPSVTFVSDVITPGSCDNRYSIARTYRATDGTGNSTTCTQTITVNDNTAPTISAGSIALCYQTVAAAETAALAATSATDNCSGTITYGAGTVGSCNATITVTATDVCGNASSTNYNTRIDNTLPVISLDASAPVACNPTTADIEAAFGGASVSDNCSVGLVATGTVESETGSGCNYSTTKSWTVTDDCGNTGTASQTVSYTRNTVNPVITLAEAAALSCNPTAADIAAAFGEASVSDNCSTGLVAEGTVESETGSGCNYSTTKNWTVTDDCGNTGTASQTVSYTRDTENPMITLGDASSLGCNPTSADIEAAFGNASVSDNCSAGLTATGTVGSEINSGTGCNNTAIAKSWTVTDACGNVGTASQTVIFTRDITAPAMTCPSNIMLSSCTEMATWTAPAATDNCGTPAVTQTAGPASNSSFDNGTTTTITYTATDGCGNSTSKSFTVARAAVLVATCSTSNDALYFGYTGDQTTTVTGTPTGGTAPYIVSITMNRPLNCNVITSTGDETWTCGAGTTSSGNTTCPSSGAASSAPYCTKTGIATGGSYSVNASLMADAVFTITVTDANGCTATCTKSINAEDVRCFAGNSNIAKITVCHKTGSPSKPCVKICIDESAWTEHQAHGDFLGPCNATCTAKSDEEGLIGTESGALLVYPNPTEGILTVEFDGTNSEELSVAVTNILGQTVYTESLGSFEGHMEKQFDFNFLNGGTYFVQVRNGSNSVITKQIVLMK